MRFEQRDDDLEFAALGLVDTHGERVDQLIEFVEIVPGHLIGKRHHDKFRLSIDAHENPDVTVHHSLLVIVPGLQHLVAFAEDALTALAHDSGRCAAGNAIDFLAHPRPSAYSAFAICATNPDSLGLGVEYNDH